MKKFIVINLCLGLLLSSCGGSGTSKITGPDLDQSKLSSIRVNQLKVTGGLEFDKDKVPEPALYIRCAGDNIDMSCAGKAQGLDVVTKEGLIYGGLDAEFESVTGIKDKTCFDVLLVFVQKNSDGCPNPIAGNDTIIWTSQSLSLNQEGIGSLLKSKIAPEDESVMAYLIGPDDGLEDDLVILPKPQSESILKLDQIYVKDKNSGLPSFLVVRDEDGKFNCHASIDKNLTGVDHNGIIYGNLNLQLLDDKENACAVTSNNIITQVTIYLYLSDGGKILKLEEPTQLLTLVVQGNKEKFGTSGYVKFLPASGL